MRLHVYKYYFVIPYMKKQPILLTYTVYTCYTYSLLSTKCLLLLPNAQLAKKVPLGLFASSYTCMTK